MKDIPVYQLKIVLKGIKPPVWRRVLVTGDSSISFLHEIVQVSMGWDNCHLHQFVIRGEEYGVSYEGGVTFADNPAKSGFRIFVSFPQSGSSINMTLAITGSTR